MNSCIWSKDGTLRVKVNLGVIAVKGYSTFSNAPEL